MSNKSRGLGKGLSALLSATAFTPPQQTDTERSDLGKTRSVDGEQLLWVSYQRLRPQEGQPRTFFSQEALEELAESIQQHGILQPLVVRLLPVIQGQEPEYEIIAGERRFRAAQLAGLTELPVFVKGVAEDKRLTLALIENIQRENLNPLEEARALKILMEQGPYTHEDMARRLGKSRAAVTNTLRLLALDLTVQEALFEGKIDKGHARALLSLESDAQKTLMKKIIEEQWSVRACEEAVQALHAPAAHSAEPAVERKKGRKAVEENTDLHVRDLEKELSERLGSLVQIRHHKEGKGCLSIYYHSLEALEGILEHIQ